MGSLAQTFSDLSAAGTKLNRKLSIGGNQGIGRIVPLGGVGPLGFNNPRDQGRQRLDNLFGVAPRQGDPGFVPPPAPPVVTPVTPMPIPGQDDLANIAARRLSIEQQLARRGRVSTVLSDQQNEPLGG